MKFPLRLIPVALALIMLSACGSDIESDPSYSNKAHDDLYKNGSLVSDQGGFDLFSGGSRKAPPTTGIGVNGFLWRASLDTISFMPIASADPFGGTILTDWYSAPDMPAERTKLNIFIRDRELTANGIKVSVFRQTRDASGSWQDAAVSPATADTLENAILTRARQIRMAQKRFN